MVDVHMLSLVANVCRKVGITIREKPDSVYLSKRELLRISNHLDLVKDVLAAKKIQEEADAQDEAEEESNPEGSA